MTNTEIILAAIAAVVIVSGLRMLVVIRCHRWKRGYLIKEWKLVDISIVSVPANSDAAISFGFTESNANVTP